MKVQGELRFVDLGSGSWRLVTDGGRELTLVGDIPETLAGQRVSVQGKKRRGLMGFAMTGEEVVEVTTVTRAR